MYTTSETRSRIMHTQPEVHCLKAVILAEDGHIENFIC